MSSKTKLKPKLNIAIFAAGMPFDDNTVEMRSLGGSETAACYMARELSNLGHNVAVFSAVDTARKFSPVLTYLPYSLYAQYMSQTDVDVNIVQRAPDALGFINKAKINILWSHDLLLKRMVPKLIGASWNIDEIWPVSNWHKKQMREVLDLHDAAYWPTRNGIDRSALKLCDSIERHAKRVAFTARPERGLGNVLDVMERVWAVDPEVELVLAEYDNKVEHMKAFYASLNHRIDLAKRAGRKVQHLGSLTKADLYKVYQAATVYAYPSNFEETSCITAMEAMATGLIMMCNTVGALPETLGYKNFVTGDGDSEKYKDLFAKRLLALLNDPAKQEKFREWGYKAAKKVCWDDLAQEWVNHLYNLFEKRSGDDARLALHYRRICDTKPLSDLIDGSINPEHAYDYPVSIVIPTMRNQEQTERLIAHHKSVSCADHQYIIIDNVGTLQHEGSLNGCTIVKSSKGNLGVTAAWNTGIEKATKDLICIANDDAWPLPGWERLMNDCGGSRGWYAGSPNEHNLYSDGQGIEDKMNGYFMLFHKDVFEKVGLFDESMFLVYSDTDMFERMRDAGLKFGIARDVFVFHEKSATRRDMGADNDNKWEVADRAVFDKKYKDRPDVLKRHPKLTLDHKAQMYVNMGKQPHSGLHVTERPEELVAIVEALYGEGDQVQFQIPFGPHKDRYHKIWNFDTSDIRDLFLNKTNYNLKTAPKGSTESGEVFGHYVVSYNKGESVPTGKIDMERHHFVQAPRETLSVCMIVKNEENMLHRCLKSVRDVADEIIIVDTGSTDSTKEIAAKYTSLIFDGPDPFEVGFAEARNFSVEKASCDWVLWLDADEELIHPERLIKYLRRNILNGYAIAQNNISVDPTVGIITVDRPLRLFRRNGKRKFYGWIHEHCEDVMNKSINPAITLSDVNILHDGYSTEAVRRKRFTRNRKMMKRDRLENPTRELGRFLNFRDKAHEARYAMEQTQGQLTKEIVAICDDVIQEYEDFLIEDVSGKGESGLQWYGECLRYKKQGIEVDWSWAMAQQDAHKYPHKKAIGRFRNQEQYIRFMNAQTKHISEQLTGKYA